VRPLLLLAVIAWQTARAGEGSEFTFKMTLGCLLAMGGFAAYGERQGCEGGREEGERWLGSRSAWPAAVLRWQPSGVAACVVRFCLVCVCLYVPHGTTNRCLPASCLLPTCPHHHRAHQDQGGKRGGQAPLAGDFGQC
jgi:hypothetical protein